MSLRFARYPLTVLFLLALAPAGFSQTSQQDAERIERWKYEWSKTDFSKFAVNLEDIISGGPPRDAS